MEEAAQTDQESSGVRRKNGLKGRYWHLFEDSGKNSKERDEIAKNG